MICVPLLRTLLLCLLAMVTLPADAATVLRAPDPPLPVSVDGLPGLTAQTRRLAPDEAAPRRDLGRGEHFELTIQVPEALRGEAVWLRVLPDYLGYAYLESADGQQQQTGVRLRLAERSQDGAHGLTRFRLTGSSFVLRLSLQSASPTLLNLQLLSDSALQQKLLLETLTAGLFYGAGSLIFLLALGSWLGSGDALFRDFALYILTALAGAAFLNGLPGIPAWLTDLGNLHAMLALASFALLGTMSILLSIRLLELDKDSPRVTRVLQAVAAGLAAVGFGALLLEDPPAVTPVLWTTHFVVELGLLAYALLQAWLRRTTRAWLVAASLLLYSAFEKVPILAIFGLLPVTAANYHTPMAGFAFQMLLIHYLLIQQLREQQQLAQRTAMARLEAAKERAHRDDLLKFLAMFGHEVRTPLAVIDSSAQSLELLPGGQEPANRQRQQRIRQSVARLQALANDALSRERLEAKGWRAAPRPTTLRALLEATLPRHGIELPPLAGGQAHTVELRDTESTARLVLDCIDPDLVFLADATMLGMALDNLLDNARKYGTPGVPVELDVLSGIAPGSGIAHLRFAVLSQGKPLEKTEVERVFEKYWRSSEHRSVGGAGLGLYLVKLVAEAHGGLVEARALPGNINSFSFEFPLRSTTPTP